MALALVQPHLLYIWKGPSLLIADTHGVCGPDQPLSGLYFREARFLRTLRFEIDGEQPWLCEAAAVSPDCLALNYVYPEIRKPGGGGTGQSGDEESVNSRGIPERALDLQLQLRVGIAELTVALAVSNRARQAVHCGLAWHVDADFADIQEALAGAREQDAGVDVSASSEQVTFGYRHPDLPFQTRIRHDVRWSFRDRQLVTDVSLPPRECIQLTLHVAPHVPNEAIDGNAARARQCALQRWREGFARFDVPGNRAVERVLRCNVRDFTSFPLLDGERDEWLAPQAGMPLYPAFFGRDALTAGWQAGCVDGGETLSAALTTLGRLQSDRFDAWRDEQPGRLPYQVRSGPLARLNLNPYGAYYADFATPLMFVISLANLWAWTGERRHLERHWDTARRILDWAREYGDPDGDGYLEYRTQSSKGAKNQGWKDSGDAIVYDDGRPVPAPIATCELQAYWYTAQELMALMAFVMGQPGDARAWHESASALKERFNRDWWVEGEQFYALALDPEKRQVRAATSNVGHCLACGVIDRAHLPAVVGRMFAPDLFSGWGIRTLSTGHAFYNPLSYHRGTVWAVEQATIVFGLRRFGFDARALDLSEGLFALAQLYPEYRIPECVGGYARGERATPGAYPRANTPQLWNATAFPLVMQSLLGLLPIAAADTLVVDPVLPSWLPDIVLSNLRVGHAKVALRFRRRPDGATTWDVLHQQGTLRVVRQPAPESLSATASDRTAAILESLLKWIGTR
ncbi:MAG TPA: glycogen debranching N-terminal domain-containing protein [Vicinamibacterales bacterium]